MASRNDNDGGAGAAIGFIMAAVIMMAMFVFALLAFVSIILTILAIVAWHRPLRIGKLTIEPHEARAFVYRGLAGSVLAPLFALFCSVLFETPIVPDYWVYIIFGGYVLGSIGVEIFMAGQQKPEVTVYTPPAQQLPPQRQDMPPRGLPAPPARFASWDDEEEWK